MYQSLMTGFSGATEEARQTNNAWVSDRTRERFPMLIPGGLLSASTRAVLTKAIYLKATWAVPFSERGVLPFTLLGDSEVTTPLMGIDVPDPYVAGDGFQAV